MERRKITYFLPMDTQTSHDTQIFFREKLDIAAAVWYNINTIKRNKVLGKVLVPQSKTLLQEIARKEGYGNRLC